MKPVSFILSEPEQLRKIKKHQYLWQILPLVILLTSFVMGARPMLYYPAVALAGIAAGLFILIGAAHRYKHRIPMPPEHHFVSPIQGRLRYVRANQELTVINIGRIFLDSVELRSPHPGVQIVDNTLQLPAPGGIITFRFNKVKVSWYEKPDLARGKLIGMVWGSGSCTISIPAGVLAQKEDETSPILPRVKKPLEICEPLFELSDPEQTEEEPQNE